jgi:para-aminobenzoate synthetase component 1
MSSWLNRLEGIESINSLGRAKIPFLFILSYDKSKIFVEPLDKLDSDILYQLDLERNYKYKKIDRAYTFTKISIPFSKYKESFEKVIEEISRGNTYLLNLTFQTPIETNLTLKEIFTHSKARFKLYFKGKFICFSPEEFIRIEKNTISTYPMKGTIDTSTPNAKEQILSNPKEMAEHTMIVDLMRNDLGIVGESIEVDSFRYIDKIRAGEKELLQVSSHIKAKLADNWSEHIGAIIDSLTPAGSITGTPKKRTIEIIDSIEDYDRGFYSGIFGIFDGSSLYSAVMIRFIESSDRGVIYKSGGGVTIDSIAQDEYEEMIDKIYLPF